VFENRLVRKIFGPKRNVVIGGWRKLHNEELHNFILNNMGEECDMHGRCLKCIENFGKPGKRSLERHKHKWEDSLKIS
jgi:hypothetical protein